MEGFGNDIGGQEGIAGMILACDDDGVGDIGMGGEEGLDFTEFDTEAADFDLMVEAAEVFDIAIGEIAGEIAGLVEPCAGEWAEGIGDEALGGEVGAMEIARGERRRRRFRRGRRWEPAAGRGRGYGPARSGMGAPMRLAVLLRSAAERGR